MANSVQLRFVNLIKQRLLYVVLPIIMCCNTWEFPMASLDALNTSWEMVMQTGNSDGLYDLASVGDESVWAVGGNGMIWHSSDGGQSWAEQATYIRIRIRCIHMLDERIGWAAGNNNLLLKTTDGGTNWQQVGLSAEATADIMDICFYDVLCGWLADNRGGVWRTNDGGANWDYQIISSPWVLMAIHFESPEKGWVLNTQQTVLHTTDGGNTWIEQSIPDQGVLINLVTTAMAFVAGGEGWIGGLYAGSLWQESYPVFHSADDGHHWRERGSIPLTMVTALDFANEDVGWAVGHRGICITLNGGRQWTCLYYNESVIFNKIRAVNKNLALAVDRKGQIWRWYCE